MRADRRDPTIKSLRSFKPSKFSITLRNGDAKAVPLSTKQNKWELLSNILEQLPWMTIEALDGDGAVLGVVEQDADIEDDGEEGDSIDKVERIAGIMLKVMMNTQSETRKMFADQARLQSESLQSMLDSNRVVRESYELALSVQRAASMAGAGGPDTPDPVLDMMKMAMALKMGNPVSVQIPSAKPPTPKPPVAKVQNGA